MIKFVKDKRYFKQEQAWAPTNHCPISLILISLDMGEVASDWLVPLVGIKMRIERFRAKGKFSKVQLQAGLHYSLQSVFDIRCLWVALERIMDALTFFSWWNLNSAQM